MRSEEFVTINSSLLIPHSSLNYASTIFFSTSTMVSIS